MFTKNYNDNFNNDNNDCDNENDNDTMTMVIAIMIMIMIAVSSWISTSVCIMSAQSSMNSWFQITAYGAVFVD